MGLKPAKEIDLSLDEIHLLLEWAIEHEEDSMAPWAKDLADRLSSVWSYWANRTDDLHHFMLRLKRM